MTKGARKTGRFRSIYRNGPFTRLSRGFPIKYKILIVGEGQETEPNYFHGLKKEDSVATRFAVTVKKGHGRTPEAVLDEALKYENTAELRKEYYDQIYCVIDVEGSSNRSSLDKAMTLAAQKQIKMILSNPCFEVWILAHFKKTAGYFLNCDAAIVRLSKYWKSSYKQEYRKENKLIYARIKDRIHDAIDRARWVRESHHDASANIADCNSSTDVYVLVERLLCKQ